MEKIGDFAKRCQTTIKTLRYYDQMGLLTPNYIDNVSGYRYYSPEKVIELNRITKLKDIGFTLDEIKQFCDASSDDERNRLMEKRQWSLINMAEEIAGQLAELGALKMNLLKGGTIMNINVKIPFENDERVIGRWEFIAEVNSKEDFDLDKKYGDDTIYEEIYFLPDGQEYWGFGWTKGYLKVTFGDGMLCPYELMDEYMFINTGSSIWVLKQTDKIHRTVYDIGVMDNVDLPFVTDERVLGKWNVVDFVDDIEIFNPLKRNWQGELFYKSEEFFPDGTDSHGIKWTKGMILDDTGSFKTASAYEIRDYNGADYLFIEWKSGDYIWGKMKPCYYVFGR